MAVAQGDTVLITLDTVKLQRTIYRIEQDELRLRAKHLNELPFLKMLSMAQCKKVSRNSFYKHCHRNQVIQSHGDLPEYIYVVVKGEFEIQKKCTEMTMQSPSMRILSKQPKSIVLTKALVNSLVGIEDVVKVRPVSFTMKCVSQVG